MGRLTAGSDTEPKCFDGLFPPDVKTVALIAPSSQGDAPEKIDRVIRLLEAGGLRLKIMPHARIGEPDGNRPPAEQRAADLEQAWLDPEVDLILCIRGGWGGVEVTEIADWAKLRAARPDMRLIGFSDITTIHMAMLHEGAGHPICGPSVRGLINCDQASLETFRTVLSGGTPDPVRLTVLRPGAISGRILAGHLQRLMVMARTRFKPDTAGKVIFTECPGLGVPEVSECWQALLDDGFFNGCAGVVFGRLNGCKELEEETIRKFAAMLDCPAFCGFPYSHTPSNHMLDLRRDVKIDETGLLHFL
ncbi:MAG: LD-carboxypeptidase [Lentisphaeria bacterium]|nr:LD-carboxypeptidase [Lentisphaeria bacterium]